MAQLEPIHIKVDKKMIAPIVLMPGDPLRAKYIAETFLENAILINSIRNMLGYTGTYKGVRVTVIGSGMGMPSMGIYSYELFTFYNVEKIIRIGTCGANKEDINVSDLIVPDSAYSESNIAYTFSDYPNKFTYPSKELNNVIIETAKEMNYKIHRGTILTLDIFGPYVDEERIINRVPRNVDIIGEEMEAFGLFHIANYCGKEAACILTVTDSKYSSLVLSDEEREKNLNNMILLALNSIIKDNN